MDLKKKLVVFLLLAVISIAIVYLGDVYWTRTTHLVLTLLAGGIMIIWTVYVLHTTYIPLKSSLQGLREAVDESEKTSTAYYNSSKSLAAGASQQASSLEETAASLEEITATTIQNAENADRGRALIEDAQSLVHRANTSMEKTSKAIGEISNASEEIGRIIKVIDEIAFQTNLLALNAAVEAARAGEHGAGFAVVADEVRNLAKRAATAAESTQDLIQNSIGKVATGVTLVKQTEADFKLMVEFSDQSAALIREIAAASAEQRTTLQQVSEAVSQIETVTQNNAMQANEAAESSEQMESKAECLREVSATLQEVLSGTNRKNLAITLVKKGIRMVEKKGLAATIAAAQDRNGPFCDGDEWYIYIGTTTGKVTLLAHPILPEKLVGPDLSNLTDIKGKTFFNNLVDTALTKGSGWINYWWPKPGETDASLKSTYIIKVPNENAYIGCGVYI